MRSDEQAKSAARKKAPSAWLLTFSPGEWLWVGLYLLLFSVLGFYVLT